SGETGNLQGEGVKSSTPGRCLTHFCFFVSCSLSECNLTERSCSALFKVLSSVSSRLTLLDLSNNAIQDSGVELLSEGLKSPQCKLEKLSQCNLTERSCSAVLKVLSSESSTLTLLDLSNNPIQDSGVEMLCEGLNSSNCKLETLRSIDPGSGLGNIWPNFIQDSHYIYMFIFLLLSAFRIINDDLTDKSCSDLARVLTSSTLRELDLSNNNLQDSGVNKLTSALKNPSCKLKTLSLSFCSVKEKGYADLASGLSKKTSCLIELDLRGNDPGDTGVKNLSDPNCKLNTLRLKNSISEDDCAALMSALCSNPSHLIELDLSGNKFGNAGVEHISGLLKDSKGKVENLSDCNVTEGGYAALALALKSNPSSCLMELDLRGNDPGDTGVKLLTELKEDQNCNLNTLRYIFFFRFFKICTKIIWNKIFLIAKTPLEFKKASSFS
uniref:Uncharacterized protein n=1 Tax=Astyanax mexicanus TaxID=7994 RepID=A0A3B1J177_ASTMX